MICIDHIEPLKVYYETCQQLICRNCMSSQCVNHNHLYKSIIESYPDHCQKMEANLTAVKKKLMHQWLTLILDRRKLQSREKML